MVCYAGTLRVSGAEFIGNSGRASGGGLFLQDCETSFSGNVSFIGNDVVTGGSIILSIPPYIDWTQGL